MEAPLFRTSSGSIPVQTPIVPGSPRLNVFSTVHKKATSSSLHMEVSRRKIRRSSSESAVIQLESKASFTSNNLGSRSFASPPQIPEEKDCEVVGGDRQANGTLSSELGTGLYGGGMNVNGTCGGRGGGGGHGGDRFKMGTYYQEMVKSDPTNSLLLRNYGKYLHEMKMWLIRQTHINFFYVRETIRHVGFHPGEFFVEKNVARAEEYYGRAILANPGDGEVLCLYGKLIWETQRDELRAKSYFNQALHASPHDCFVLGKYAQFLWEAEVEEKEEGHQEMERSGSEAIAAIVEVF